MNRRDVFKGLLATGVLLPIANTVSGQDKKPAPKPKASKVPQSKKEIVKSIMQVHELLNDNPEIIKRLASEGYMVDHDKLSRLLWEAINS